MVDDADFDLGGAEAAGAYFEFAARAHGLGGVADEVGPDLAQIAAARVDLEVGFEGGGDVGVLERGAEDEQGVFEVGAEVDAFGSGGGGAGVVFEAGDEVADLGGGGLLGVEQVGGLEDGEAGGGVGGEFGGVARRQKRGGERLGQGGEAALQRARQGGAECIQFFETGARGGIAGGGRGGLAGLPVVEPAGGQGAAEEAGERLGEVVALAGEGGGGVVEFVGEAGDELTEDGHLFLMHELVARLGEFGVGFGEVKLEAHGGAVAAGEVGGDEFLEEVVELGVGGGQVGERDGVEAQAAQGGEHAGGGEGGAAGGDGVDAEEVAGTVGGDADRLWAGGLFVEGEFALEEGVEGVVGFALAQEFVAGGVVAHVETERGLRLGEVAQAVGERGGGIGASLRHRRGCDHAAPRRGGRCRGWRGRAGDRAGARSRSG